jgi:hypothetical protein
MLPLLLLAVLQAQHPTLDGTIAPGEWDRASRVTGSNNLEVFLLPADSALYLAVRGTGDGFPHVALIRGDAVLILHASAALGTAMYGGDGERKHLLQPFDFRVRGTSRTGRDQEERDAFYAQEGWVASTIRMGVPGETEFKIARSLVAPGDRIAVAYWSETAGVTHWPAALGDAVVLERMVQGHLPEESQFRPEEWGVVPARR